MRQERTIQASLFDLYGRHEFGRELAAMSGWLDQMGEAVALVAADLGIGECQATGRHGLPAEAALRCGLLKQYFQLSYQELAFHVSDSVSLRTFARLPLGWNPRKSVLQKTISAISPTTWGADQPDAPAPRRGQQVGDRQADQDRQHGQRDDHP